MSFPRYATYQDSGIRWLDSLPTHWRCEPIKAVSTCNDDVLTDGTAADFEMQYVEISDVELGLGIRGSSTLFFADAPSRARRRVADGDVIISTVRTYLKAIGRVVAPAENLVVSTGFAVIRPRSIHSGFLGHLVTSEYVISEVISRSVGVSYPAINASDIMRIKVPIPPFPEQVAIAGFLDREMAKIDALVEEQRRLIALLKEKRQAVISHAVTKGLDPNTPMKDSGVEWLGEIPAHWDFKPVWLLFSLGRGRVLSHQDIADQKGPYAVYSSQTENNGEMGFIATYDFEGDYLTWTTDGANAGTVFRRSGRFNCTNVCGTLKPKSALDLSYFNHALTEATGFFVRHDINPKLMNNVMAGIRLPVPSLPEQQRIATYIELETGGFSSIERAADSAISLLQERRSALISAAVTGKIDVRGLAPAEAEAA